MAVVRLAAAAPIHPLAWELPYATGVAIKGKKEKKYIYIYLYLFQKEVVSLTLAQGSWRRFSMLSYSRISMSKLRRNRFDHNVSKADLNGNGGRGTEEWERLGYL